MAALEKISTLNDMKVLMSELHRLEAKFLFDYYGVLQDFSSKKLLPQWLQKKGLNKAFISDKGKDILSKLNNSKKLSVIIYDLETPDLNGLEFLVALGPEIRDRCKIIFMAPKLALDVQNKLLQMGVTAIIPKPLDEESLRATFEKIGLDY
jgi:DNA-binding NtrC family response regulator